MERLGKAPATSLIVLANALVFLAVEISGGSLDTQNMISWGAMYAPFCLEQGEYYRLFTSIFLHFGLAHLVNNMLVLYVLGDHLERAMGKAAYLILYLAGGVGGNLLSLLLDVREGTYAVSAGASGAVFAVMGGLLWVILVNRGKLEDFTTRKLLIVAGFSLYFGFTSSGVDNAAHVGGLACGFLLAVLLYRRKRSSRRSG